jgi:hypothetical protein
MDDETYEPVEDFLVDVSQCGNKHIHVALQGRAQGEVAFDDFDAFATFAESCQVFVARHSPVPNDFLDAFGDEW